MKKTIALLAAALLILAVIPLTADAAVTLGTSAGSLSLSWDGDAVDNGGGTLSATLDYHTSDNFYFANGTFTFTYDASKMTITDIKLPPAQSDSSDIDMSQFIMTTDLKTPGTAVVVLLGMQAVTDTSGPFLVFSIKPAGSAAVPLQINAKFGTDITLQNEAGAFETVTPANLSGPTLLTVGPSAGTKAVTVAAVSGPDTTSVAATSDMAATAEITASSATDSTTATAVIGPGDNIITNDSGQYIIWGIVAAVVLIVIILAIILLVRRKNKK